MFKHCIIYRLDPAWSMDLLDMEVALAAMPFAPCGPTQTESSGWVPPRGADHGALVESIAGQRIFKLQIERKSVPASAINRKLSERVAQIEQNEGRKPGRKEQRELKDEILLELLPHAFPKISTILTWLDLEHGRLVLDCGSQGNADKVITALVQCLPGLQVSLLNTQVAPQAAMTQWLVGEPDQWPAPFAAGRHVELHSGDEMKSVVKFDRHHLDDEQMRLHISQGKLPTKLAMDWDGRVQFVLTEGLQLRKVAFLDGVFENPSNGEQEEGFDADIAIATGELSALITDLVQALGGEYGQESGAA
jgi:recombination associated protein RdgC